MEYLDLCRMREVGYTSTKLLSVRVRSFCQSMWETRSESAHGHWLKRATLGIHCSSASTGGYQTVLPYCRRPLLDWGEFRIRTERYEYMYRATPNIYIYIYKTHNILNIFLKNVFNVGQQKIHCPLCTITGQLGLHVFDVATDQTN